MITVDELAKLNSEFNSLKKKLDEAKIEYKSKGVGTYNGEEYKAVVETRTSQKLNLEKATKVAKELNMRWVLKEIVNEEALEDSIATGEIDGSKFADCIEEKSVVAIKFVKMKKGK